MEVQNKHILVVGLARSGLAVARALARRGAVVTVTDRKPPAEFREALPQLIKDKVGLELGSQRVETFLRHEAIVVSPGVPWDLPQLQAARAKMIPVYPEVEAASWFLEGTLVGITGSNGKTTTTALLGDMLKASGFPTFVGGNIGNALSCAVDRARPGTRFVTELSSFQLEGIHEFRPHVAVMLNLSPNHLDRHPSLEAYAQAKRRIFQNQRGKDYAVLNADDPWVAGLRAEVSSRPMFFSRHRELPSGVFVSGGKIYYRARHLERVLFETRDVSLRGDFNLEDVLAATTAACVLGADFAAIRKAVRGFKAVEHRLEFAGEIQGVDFYNNSKATSVDATLKSLEAFERGVHLILGGKDKGAPYTPLIPLIKERVRDVLLIGSAAPVITEQLAGHADLVQAGDLSTAVYEAFARSRPGDTVLLAPACSSFDQFKDYEERGRVFKELVKKLAKDVAGKGQGARDKGQGTRETVRDTAPVPTATQKEAPVAAAEPPRPHVPGPALDLHEPPKAPERAGDLPTAQTVLVAPAPPPEGAPLGRSAPTETASVEALPPPENAPLERAVPQPASEIQLPPVPSAEEHAETSVDAAVAESAPEGRGSVHAAPHHLELTYVFEVDAVEMLGTESQVVPEDEPVISLSASTAETEDDDVLPYEVRPARGNSEFRIPDSEAQGKSGIRNPKFEISSAQSEVRSSESEIQNLQPEVRSSDSEVEGESGIQNPESEIPAAGPDAPPTPQQPKLFDGSDGKGN